MPPDVGIIAEVLANILIGIYGHSMQPFRARTPEAPKVLVSEKARAAVER
jgi:hypothetical protein